MGTQAQALGLPQTTLLVAVLFFFIRNGLSFPAFCLDSSGIDGWEGTERPLGRMSSRLFVCVGIILDRGDGRLVAFLPRDGCIIVGA